MDTSSVKSQELQTVADACRAAVAALDRALHAPPVQVGQEADLAEREVVRARDVLILRLRQNPNGDSAGLRATLDRVNSALSLVVGLAYPMAGVERKLIEQARDALQSIAVDLEH